MELNDKEINVLVGMINESIQRQLNESKKAKKNKDEKSAASNKKNSVLKWINSAQIDAAVLCKQLWPHMNQDTARSLFSKKRRGHDANGIPYSFNDDEINKLFNMKDRFISRIDESKDNRIKDIIDESIDNVLGK